MSISAFQRRRKELSKQEKPKQETKQEQPKKKSNKGDSNDK